MKKRSARTANITKKRPARGANIMTTSLKDFDGVSVGNQVVLDVLTKSVGLASSLLSVLPGSITHEVQRMAALSAINTVSSLLVVAGAKCNLDVPPADIGAVTDSSGNLIYRCHHKQPHSWDLNGHKL
jgi:hypothetical protein